MKYRILKVRGRDYGGSFGYYQKYYPTEYIYVAQIEKNFLWFSWWKALAAGDSLYPSWCEFIISYDKEKKSFKKENPVVVKEYD